MEVEQGLKRLFDVVAAAIGVVVSMPAMLVTATARDGKNHKAWHICKKSKA